MIRAALMAALLAGCAGGIRGPNGEAMGFALGHASVTIGTPLAVSSVGGAFVGDGLHVAGGDLSTTFAGMASALGTLAITYFSGGMW